MRVFLSYAQERVLHPLISLLALLSLMYISSIWELSEAYAGDPCPISYTIYELGTPPWLKRDEVLERLESKESWLGMSFRTSSKHKAVQVLDVSPQSPAQLATLKVGDLITHWNGQKIKTHQELSQRLDQSKAEALIQLKIRRTSKQTDQGKTQEEVLSLALTLKQQDPLVRALLKYASSLKCAYVRRGSLSPSQVKSVMPALLEKNKRFRCADAHKRTVKILPTLNKGDVLVIRGSKRVLLTHVGWTTKCVYAHAFDGDRTGPTYIKPLFEQLTKAYTEDRFRHP